MMYRRGTKFFMFVVFTYTSCSQASDNVILSLSHPSNVARFAPKTKDGLLDKTFGTAGNGKVTTNLGGTDVARSIVLQSDGKIVVAGESNNGNNKDFALVRYTSAGALDTTFGADGIRTTNVNVNGNDVIYSMVLQPDGKIVVAGSSGT